MRGSTRGALEDTHLSASSFRTASKPPSACIACTPPGPGRGLTRCLLKSPSLDEAPPWKGERLVSNAIRQYDRACNALCNEPSTCLRSVCSASGSKRQGWLHHSRSHYRIGYRALWCYGGGARRLRDSHRVTTPHRRLVERGGGWLGCASSTNRCHNNRIVCNTVIQYGICDTGLY
jgi:hypothetical protein